MHPGRGGATSPGLERVDTYTPRDQAAVHELPGHIQSSRARIVELKNAVERELGKLRGPAMRLGRRGILDWLVLARDALNGADGALARAERELAEEEAR